MAPQKTVTVEITFSEALQGGSQLNHNPLIDKLRLVPHIGPQAELCDPMTDYCYIVRIPQVVPPMPPIIRPPIPTRHGKTFRGGRSSSIASHIRAHARRHPAWRFIVLPPPAREWLFNYLHRDIALPITFTLDLPPDAYEDYLHRKQVEQASQAPQPKLKLKDSTPWLESMSKNLRKKQRKKDREKRKKIAKTLDIFEKPDMMDTAKTVQAKAEAVAAKKKAFATLQEQLRPKLKPNQTDQTS